MPLYQFNIYPADEDGVFTGQEIFENLECKSDSSARSKAGSLAKKYNGSVDLAYDDQRMWEDRYITTAFLAPKDVWASGYRFERLT